MIGITSMFSGREDVPEKKGMDLWKQMSSKCSFTCICGIVLPLNPSATTVYARSAFYPNLHFTLRLQSAFYTQSAFYPWSAVCSLQSAVCVLHWPCIILWNKWFFIWTWILIIWLNYTVNSASASTDTVRWTCTSLIQIPRVGPCNHSSVFCLIMTLWGEHLQTYMYYSAGLTDQTVSILERFAGFDLVLMHRSVKV